MNLLNIVSKSYFFPYITALMVGILGSNLGIAVEPSWTGMENSWRSLYLYFYCMKIQEDICGLQHVQESSHKNPDPLPPPQSQKEIQPYARSKLSLLLSLTLYGILLWQPHQTKTGWITKIHNRWPRGPTLNIAAQTNYI